MIHRLTFLFVVLFSAVAAAVPYESHKVMIAAPSPYAVETAKKIYRAGGNVADAAVAMSLTLSVTSPYFAALGGGGFALLKLGGRSVEAIDFREVAPSRTGPDYYKDKSSQDGGAAVGVPGFPAGLWAIHKKYGKLAWRALFADALELAEKGFQVSGEWARYTSKNQPRLDKNAAKYLFKPKGAPYLPGEVLKQPQLAKALRLLRDKGEAGFYSGAVAADIANTVKKAGGVLEESDLKSYKVRWLTPVETEFKGHKIHMMPPPSSGGIVMKTAFALAEKTGLEKLKYLSADELHLLGEILANSFRGRTLLADPDFHKNPIGFLTSNDYVSKVAKEIDPKKTTAKAPLNENDVPKESETTHYSILDADGNSVALTVTLNGNYGSGVVSEKFGIALNNEMDDFTTKPGVPNQFGLIQGMGNRVEPGKRPISSMSPTLIEKDGKIVMSVGSPGGPRIISAVFQVIYRTLVTGLDLDAAIQAPRVHHQTLPNILYADSQRLSPDVLEALRKRGHIVEESPVAKVFGARKNSAGVLEGAYDSRGEGAAGGF